MLRLAGLLAFALVVGCTSDTFATGTDGGDSGAGPDAQDEGTLGDAVTGDVGQVRFCSEHPAAIFCDDFDDPSEVNPWSMWSTTSPSPPSPAFTFDPGVSGRGATATASAAGAAAYMTKEVQASTVPHSLALDLKLASAVPALTLVRINASSSTLTIETNALGNFVAKGDSSTSGQLGKTDTGWHHFDVTIGAQNALVTEDNSTKATVAFVPQTDVKLDVGIVASTVGTGVTSDNVLVQ